MTSPGGHGYQPNRRTRRIPRGTAAAAARALTRMAYRTDAARWAKDILDIDLWSLQRAIGNSVVTNRRTAVKSCHGAGKSFLAAVLIAWWIDTHPWNDTFVVWTAPRWPQVRAVIGRELRKIITTLNAAHGYSPGQGYRLTQDMQLYAPDGTHIGQGRKPADKDDHGFQGLHATWLLAIIDEACGVAPSIWTGVRTIATVATNRILAIGNPDDPESEFAEVCSMDSGWSVFRINALKTPNFTDEKHELPAHVLAKIVQQSFVDDAERDWGIGSPLWVSKVLGDFPETREDSLINAAMLERAWSLDLPGSDPGRFAFDIAGEGDDETCGYRNRGGQVRLVYSAFGKDTADTTDDIDELLKPIAAVPAWVDRVGIGDGVFTRLRKRGRKVWGFNGGSKARDPKRFKNKRAEAFWTLRELMLDDLVDLDRADKALGGQLTKIRYGKDAAGRIYIESKDDMRARGVKSPDRGDAVSMSVVESATAPAHAVEDTTSRGRAPMKVGIASDLLDKAM